MKVKYLFTGIALSALITLPCFASTIVLGINGDAQVGSTFINFGQFPAGAPYATSPGYGTFEVSLVNPGIFQTGGVANGEFGQIQSLDETTTIPGTTYAPNPSTALPFMTFGTPATGGTGGSNLKIFLTELLPGTTLGPFNLADTPNGATASFDINGFVYNTTTKSEQGISGLFQATFAGMTVAELEAQEAAGTNIETPFSGTFAVTAVPEPASLLLMGAGLLAGSLITRRKIRK